MRHRRWRSQLWGPRIWGIVVSMLLSGLAGAAAHSAGLADLIRDRTSIAEGFAAHVARCIERPDTDHAVFHGCIDWHSAVHATWALVAFARLTGDRRYDPVLARLLTKDGIAEERRLLADDPDFEMPYGRAWFLRLARDHRAATGSEALGPMADDVFASLMAHYRRTPPDPADTDYASASWALINMLDFAESRDDRDAVETIHGWVREHFLSEAPCNPARERGFMAICTHRAWLASRVLAADRLAPWLAKVFPDGLPEPITDPRGWHQHGLNFSRAWGLAALYRSTGEQRYADAYAAHVSATLSDPANWRGNYLGVGHWVPQFGMLAAEGLFEGGR